MLILCTYLALVLRSAYVIIAFHQLVEDVYAFERNHLGCFLRKDIWGDLFGGTNRGWHVVGTV